MEGGGDDAGGLPVVRICAPCVEAAADALDLERRLREARASQPPRKKAEASDRPGVLVDWTPLSIDGETLRWKAERAVAMSPATDVVMSVRRPSDGRTVTVVLDGSAEPTTAQVLEAATWLAREPSAPGKSLGLMSDWTRLADSDVEWKAERLEVVQAKTVVQVTVKNPKSGQSVTQEFDAHTTPGVEEAVMVAAVSPELIEGGAPSGKIAEHESDD